MGMCFACIEWDSHGRVQESKNVQIRPRNIKKRQQLGMRWSSILSVIVDSFCFYMVDPISNPRHLPSCAREEITAMIGIKAKALTMQDASRRT